MTYISITYCICIREQTQNISTQKREQIFAFYCLLTDVVWEWIWKFNFALIYFPFKLYAHVITLTGVRNVSVRIYTGNDVSFIYGWVCVIVGVISIRPSKSKRISIFIEYGKQSEINVYFDMHIKMIHTSLFFPYHSLSFSSAYFILPPVSIILFFLFISLLAFVLLFLSSN